MSFLKNLFGKNDPPKNVPPALSDEARFEQELLATVPRYISKPKANVDLRARHPETKEVIPFAAAFPDTFQQWKQIRSVWDRRSVIYQLLDQQLGNQLELWQVMERFTDDRYAEKALAVAAQHATDEDRKSADFFAAAARAKFVLARYAEAEQDATKALEIDGQNRRARIVLADILHYNRQEQKAHELYNSLLQERLGALPKDQTTTLAFQELVGFDGDILHSPEYAAGWLNGDKNAGDEAWDAAAEEFYFSPHFRAQHAFYLIRKKETLKGFSKLLILSQEMPWFRDAVVNAHSLIGQLGLNDAKMQQEKVRLEKIMQEKGWSANDPGMHKMSV